MPIILEWEDLFYKHKEYINTVTDLKLSPYYTEFEEELLLWEDKLNRIKSVLDVWIDVQRRWVYLDDIFDSSTVIHDCTRVYDYTSGVFLIEQD